MEIFKALAQYKKWILIALGAILIPLLWNNMVYYNKAGYITQVMTKLPFQTEKVVDTVGFTWIGFGTYTPWPRQMSVQAVSENSPKSSLDSDGPGSSIIQSFPVTFLGGVTADVDANVRVALPTGEPFLKLAQIYRTPDNFVVQGIVPAVKSTLQSTSQLMTADDYYNGGATEFRQSFQDQITDGAYVVRRIEKKIKNAKTPTQSASATNGTEQGEFGDDTSVKFVTEKVLDAAGQPIRLDRQFTKLGVTVADANIMNIDPSPQFKQRMLDIQTSQAAQLVARQDRLTADEQKQLETANGEKETEKQRQIELRDQATRSTKAETDRMVAVTEANREKERAQIDKVTAQLNYERMQIDAKTTKEKAEADAYAKRVVMQADGALTQKLEARVRIEENWANAFRDAKVPQMVFGGGGEGGVVGRSGDTRFLQDVVGIKAAKDLMLDLNVTK